MRRVFFLFFLLFVSVALGLLIHKDPGYILISYGHWSLESSFWVGFAALVVLFVVLYYLLIFFRHTANFSVRIQAWRVERQYKKALTQTNFGLCELAEGNWQTAEQALIKATKTTKSPLINYLGAARAAQEQTAYDRRDRYLKLAHESTKGSEAAVGLTQAQLQIKSQQWEQALATLRDLNELVPRHPYTLKLLSRVYTHLGDWSELQSLLPVLRKNKVFTADRLEQIEESTYLALMDQRTPTSLDNLEEVWRTLPRAQRFNAAVIRAYVLKLIQLKQTDAAIALLVKTLKKQWQPSLLSLYADALGSDSMAQLSQAEAWLKKHPDDVHLLLCLGQLCLRNELWGKAQEYLSRSLALKPQAITYQCLGLLEEKQNNLDSALKYYRQGLTLNRAGRC